MTIIIVIVTACLRARTEKKKQRHFYFSVRVSDFLCLTL